MEKEDKQQLMLLEESPPRSNPSPKDNNTTTTTTSSHSNKATPPDRTSDQAYTVYCSVLIPTSSPFSYSTRPHALIPLHLPTPPTHLPPHRPTSCHSPIPTHISPFLILHPTTCIISTSSLHFPNTFNSTSTHFLSPTNPHLLFLIYTPPDHMHYFHLICPLPQHF
ncbi:hypothetical protein Pcinc_012934 [Petrolisthes cinctipes]|uniref:Uncharacterized protein n=1 Tax=Petrolisthes cinctipes TaxID=88211 RepID=A0AAE1KS42_PETCI|nr:hypothetical protein Pcinc_012934 [Petrolisthes cinctipes]